MSGLPQAVFNELQMPHRSLGTLPTTNPSGRGAAQGRVPEGGLTMVEVSATCTLTIYVWSEMSDTWVNPSSSSASYQKTFAAAGMDFFEAPVGALFYIKSSAGSITAYTSGDTVVA